MYLSKLIRPIFAFVAFASVALAQGPANVLVVTNDKSQFSRDISAYYIQKREIPAKNVCHIQSSIEEEISRNEYTRNIAAPISLCLRRNQLTQQILYIATTAGVPLKISGQNGLNGDYASVDNELALLYSDIATGKPHALNGWLPNPFFRQRDIAFTHPQFPIYLVTRLAAYDLAGVRAMIDRGLVAMNRGKFVIDLNSDDAFADGNNWLADAAIRLPEERVVYDASPKVLYKQTDVIGYASWGSNDDNRQERLVGFRWLPGAIATEYVSTNARTFVRPPASWTLSDWNILSRPKWFAGSPQSLTADYLEEGASAVTGHVYEPYLASTPRPDYLLPAYFKGRNLAESYYLSIPYLSWQNIVAGDPLMSLK